jgi:hypothetical protein
MPQSLHKFGRLTLLAQGPKVFCRISSILHQSICLPKKTNVFASLNPNKVRLLCAEIFPNFFKRPATTKVTTKMLLGNNTTTFAKRLLHHPLENFAIYNIIGDYGLNKNGSRKFIFNTNNNPKANNS